MSPWLSDDGHLFHPSPRITEVPLGDGERCLVVDDVLARPEAVRDWACAQRFTPPPGYPYPGVVHDLPGTVSARWIDLFQLRARGPLGARRTLAATVRLCLVTTPPQDLEPRQWLCHRDRIADDPRSVLFAASVLYLFRDPALGGTSFYRPRQDRQRTEQLIADSQRLDAAAFSARYGVAPGYMRGSNDWFERVARIEPAWNRALFYDGGLFHSADVDDPARLTADPASGRLTVNGFFTCQRRAG